MDTYPSPSLPEAELTYSVPYQETRLHITGDVGSIQDLYETRVEAERTARRANIGSLALAAPASALRGLLGRLTTL